MLSRMCLGRCSAAARISNFSFGLSFFDLFRFIPSIDHVSCRTLRQSYSQVGNFFVNDQKPVHNRGKTEVRSGNALASPKKKL